MLDNVIGGYGFGHKDHISSGFGFQEHKEFMSHEESERGYFDRQARYDHHMRLPGNHGRPPMAHMPVCDEEDSDSDVEEYFESHRSHHTTVSPHKQPPHDMNFLPHQKVHNGKMGNGWQGKHEDAYHGAHGMQHQGGHGMQQHGGHGMQQHGGHGMQHHGGHEMKHHGGYEMENHGGHGMKHHGGYEMEHHGGHGMKHQNKLMAPQVPPHHVFMNPIHGNGGGRAVVMEVSENCRVRNKVGWKAKGL